MQPRPPPFRSTWTVIRSFPFTPAPYVTTARSDGPDRRIRAGFTVICRGAPMTVLEQNTDQDGAERKPRGSLSIRTLAMPADTNQYGDIFGGWLLGQMDIAGGILAATIAKGRTATIAVDGMTFRKPVYVGDVVAFCLHSKDVLISAGHDVDRTTHQSVKRFASAFK